MNSPNKNAQPHDGNEHSASQANTQPFEPLNSSQDDFQLRNKPPPNAWGQLIRISDNAVYNLISDAYTVGRGRECSILLDGKQLGPRAKSFYGACSKHHFKIYREATSGGKFIFLEDQSSNGTFVNKEKVGKGRFIVLNSGDSISLVNKTHRVYCFLVPNQKRETDGVFSLVQEKYMFLKHLGSGACGSVDLCIRKSDHCRLACKSVDLKYFNTESVKKLEHTKEIKIMATLDHPCIIKVAEVIQTEEKVYIFMELSEGGDLFGCLKNYRNLEEDHAKKVVYQICLAIKYLHENGVVHRDLKPENILLSSLDGDHQIVKVTDFGLSAFIPTSSLLHTLCGTPHYVAPEVLADVGLGNGYTKAVDIWSIGVIMFICITGEPPFSEQRRDCQLKDQILLGSYKLKESIWSNLPYAKDLVQKLIVVDPQKRLSIGDALNHPWFQDEKMKASVETLLEEERLTNIVKPPDLSNIPLPDSKKRRLEEYEECSRSDATTPLLAKRLSQMAESDPSSN